MLRLVINIAEHDVFEGYLSPCLAKIHLRRVHHGIKTNTLVDRHQCIPQFRRRSMKRNSQVILPT